MQTLLSFKRARDFVIHFIDVADQHDELHARNSVTVPGLVVQDRSQLPSFGASREQVPPRDWIDERAHWDVYVVDLNVRTVYIVEDPFTV